MTELKTLTDIRDYLETIPKEKWCRDTITDGDKHCWVGHFHNMPNRPKLEHEILDELVQQNDSRSGDPKTNVINYLSQKIKEQTK